MRLIRQVFNLATAISLLLCLAMGVFWVRSHFVLDVYLSSRASGGERPLLRRVEFTSASGGIALTIVDWQCREPSVVEAKQIEGSWRHWPDPADEYPGDVYGLGDLDKPPTLLNRFGLDGAWIVDAVGKNGVSSISSNGQIDWIRSVGIAIPYWLMFVMTAIAPVITAVRISCRRNAGHCACGYNLTGSTSGVCPECGNPIAAVGKVTA